MPAMTVKSLSDQLSSYCSPDQQFLPVLNLILPRLYSMGYWRDLCYEMEITTSNGYFSLPAEAESIMCATVDGTPKNLWAQWHDYKVGGTPNSYSAYPIFGIVDDGYGPAVEVIPSDINHSVRLVTISPNLSLPADGSVYVGYEVESGLKRNYLFEIDDSATMVIPEPDTDIRKITEVRFQGVPVKVRLEAFDTDTETKVYTLAEGRGDFVARYRRYRTSQPSNGDTQKVFLLLKRAFLPLMDESDIVYLGNVNAIKCAILATTAEDNADIERSGYHWQVCRQLLEEEKDASRGGARQVFTIDPYSGNGTPQNMY
jgi:hypothetical protein